MLAWGPHRIGWKLGIARSTVYAVLRRAGLHRLAWLHRTTREPLRASPSWRAGSPGFKKLGRIPQGGGKRILPGFAETRSGPQRGPLGFDFVHVAVDDHSRYAYAEALPDERGVALLLSWSGRLPTSNAKVSRSARPDRQRRLVSRIFTSTAAARNLRLKRTRPFRPQTNGKAEAFNKIMQAEWAYQRPYSSNRERPKRCLASLRITITAVRRDHSRSVNNVWELHLGASACHSLEGEVPPCNRQRAGDGQGTRDALDLVIPVRLHRHQLPSLARPSVEVGLDFPWRDTKWLSPSAYPCRIHPSPLLLHSPE